MLTPRRRPCLLLQERAPPPWSRAGLRCPRWWVSVGTEEPTPDPRGEGPVGPSGQVDGLPSDASERDPWRPISPRTRALFAGVGEESEPAHSPLTPLSVLLGEPEEEVVQRVEGSSDEDIFGDRELGSPAPGETAGEGEAVSLDEEEEEVARGLPVITSPRRFRRSSSSSSGSPSVSPCPQEGPAEEVLLPEPAPASPSRPPSMVVSPQRRRRRQRESDSSSSPERSSRRRRRVTPLEVGESITPPETGGVVPPSSPSAIVTVPGVSIGPMAEGIGALYRSGLRRLLRSAPVPRSRRAGDEDPESDPDSEDGWFMSTVLALESYRTRPSSRSGRGQPRSSRQRTPSSLVELLSGVEDPFAGGWAVIPQGFVSEWFPNRPALEEGECPACQATEARERACREQARALWNEEVTRNSRPEASGRGAFLWADNSARPRIWVPLASHSCALGREVHFPVVFLSSQNLAAYLPGPEAFGVQLRVVLHLGIPSGLLIQWRSGGTHPDGVSFGGGVAAVLGESPHGVGGCGPGRGFLRSSGRCRDSGECFCVRGPPVPWPAEALSSAAGHYRVPRVPE